MNELPDAAGETQRLDRWLWFARFFKSRTLAASHVSAGKVRVNGDRVSRPSRTIRPGDILTFPAGPHIRVIKVVAPGTRRGPAPEARLLYEDQAPPAEASRKEKGHPKAETREVGSGRPTKRERRQTDAFKKRPY